MTTRKIKSDEANDIFTKSDRNPINNALVLTGGGITQTFFSMGAVACLIDNNLFDFDLITAVSGGSLLLVFIDLCYNEAYNYYKEPDWYNRYVRKSIYSLATAKLLPYFIKSMFNLTKLQTYIFSKIPDFNKVISSTENNKIICEYNYIDGNTGNISCDHSDIIDFKNNVVVDYWYLMRPARCTLPFCILNNKPTYDCGNVNNIPVSSIATNYNINGKLVIVKSCSNIIYESYPEKTIIQLLTGIVFSNMTASDSALNDLIDVIVKPNDCNIMCCASNNLNKSRDKYHKGMIDYLYTDLTQTVRFYNGFLYTNENAMKICENEGYIQMYHQLKKRNKNTIFKIPNPKVYNKRAKRMYNDWKTNTSPWSELFKDIQEMKV